MKGKVKAEKDCSINTGHCIKEIETDSVTVVFDILPKPVSTMQELMYRVILTENGLPVTDASVAVDLTMPGMFMGINRPLLSHTVDGIYEGKGIIQICPHGGKTWRAEVKVTRKERTASVSFTFEVE